MDYEKKYKEALERAKFLKKYLSPEFIRFVDELFPELQESEDEKIRKILINLVESNGTACYINKIHKDKIFAWLEKQGEQKPIFDFKAKDWYVSKVDGKIHNIYHSVDKVEPKFKVGNWIVDKSGLVQQVLDFRGGIYTCTYNSFTTDCESNYHLWTIQDAKDGDVLQLGNVTAIFKKFIGNKKCYCYCSVWDGKFEIPTQSDSYGCYIATPATKEQRDLLEKAMTDAGYTFDFEKKELKKITAPKSDADDKIEPKFKVGDWVVRKDGGIFCSGYKFTQICKIDDKERYLCDNDFWVKKEDIRLWTIEDAKDGDVLISSFGNPFIYNAYFDSVYVGAYCAIGLNDEFIITDGQPYYYFWTAKFTVRPATEKEIELLFNNMKEAGYKWDSDKKELIKL